MKPVLVAALAMILAGCRGHKPGELPTVRYGIDPCARCGMAVSEERFASGYVDEEGSSVAFDDVGEFLATLRLQPSLAQTSYVHDAQDGRWLRASEAIFVHIAGLSTPMGTGFAAFSSEAHAQSFGKRLGTGIVPLSLARAIDSL